MHTRSGTAVSISDGEFESLELNPDFDDGF